MKNVEIVSYKEYVWGSIVKVKCEGLVDHMVSAKVGIIVGSLALMSFASLYAGFLLAKILDH